MIRIRCAAAALVLWASCAGAQSATETAAAIDRSADPRAAVAAWQGALPGLGGQARGRALGELAAALVADQRPALAIKAIEEAKPLLLRARPIDRARVLSAEASARADLNQIADADKAADAALSEWREAAPGGSEEQADVVMTKATIAMARGDMAAAKQLATTSLKVYERLGGSPSAGRIAANANMSTFYLQDRELEKSELYAREAISLAAGLPEDHPVALVALNNWVAVLAAQGRREESVDVLGRIARIREKRYGPDYAPLAITYNNLSRNLMFLKRAGQAEPFARRAVAIAEKTRAADDQALAALRDNLADIVEDLEQPAAAVELRRAALRGLGGANEQRAMRIRRSLGISLIKQRDLAAALNEYTIFGEWLHRSRPAENAEVLAVDSERVWLEAELNRPGSNMRLRELLDRVERGLFAGGDASRRITELAQSLGHLLDAAWRTGDRPTGFRIAQLVVAGDASRAVAAAIERESVGRSAPLVRRRQDLLAERDARSAAALRAFGKDQEGFQAATREVGRIDADLALVEHEIAQTVPAFAALARLKPLTEAEVSAQLGRRQALVMTLQTAKGALTFVLRRSGGAWAKADVEDVTADVAALRAGLTESGRFDQAGAHRLYRALIPPALDRTLAGADSWALVPGGVFTAVPFAALVTAPPRAGARPAWLIRKVALVTLPGLGELNRPAPLARGDRFVGVGAPALAGGHAPGALRGFYSGGATRAAALAALAPLPAARRELERMGGALPGYRATLFTGADATETAVKAADYRGTAVLAFATHGLVGGALEPGSEPGLVLTPPAAPGAADDGLLTASEIARLDLPVDWVVLSACDTAAGASPGAPALSGLARAFLYAGARSLLVSHWAVRDDVAARLTVETVRRAQAGASRPQALRRAMLALIDDPKVAGAGDPAVWAPFILVQR